MPNDIPDWQNQPEAMDLLCAISGAYARAKWLASLQTMLVISSAVFGPAFSLLNPELKWLSAIYAFVVLILDLLVLEPQGKKHQELGASLQELFDTKLLGLPWNKVRCYSPPEHEEIAKWALLYRKQNKTDWLKNWYAVEAGEVPIEYGRLICQRANMQWDAALRRNYCAFFVAFLVLLVIAGGVLGALMKWPVDQFFLSIVFPFLPVVVKIWGECRKHLASAAATEKAKSVLDSTWDKAKKGSASSEELLEDSRRLQDELFDRRRQSPTVPHWLYARSRDAHEFAMKYGSEKMVKEIKAMLAAKAK